eukprot:m.383148 g.383148  ORF g.383148 m.383148 type:complete len:53 (-) comp122335_c0_seq1:8-166(-)
MATLLPGDNVVAGALWSLIDIVAVLIVARVIVTIVVVVIAAGYVATPHENMP